MGELAALSAVGGEKINNLRSSWWFWPCSYCILTKVLCVHAWVGANWSVAVLFILLFSQVSTEVLQNKEVIFKKNEQNRIHRWSVFPKSEGNTTNGALFFQKVAFSICSSCHAMWLNCQKQVFSFQFCEILLSISYNCKNVFAIFASLFEIHVSVTQFVVANSKQVIGSTSLIN